MNVGTSRIAVGVVGILASAFLQAQQTPLSNWTVPAYRANGASGGLTTMSDVTPGVGFVGVAPCRLVDTRQAGFPPGWGTPSLVQGQPRSFDLNSDPLCPGIPAGVDAYSLNITVTNTQGPGFILIYPQGGSQPTVSTVNYVAGQTIANAAIVPAGTNGSVTVIAGVSGADLIIDINGYFSDALGSNQFEVRSGGGTAIYGENTGSGYGVWGNSATGYGVVGGGGAGGVWATTSGAGSGVYGQNTGGAGSGVYGQHTGSGYGIYGKSATGFGVVAETGGSGSNAAVYATNASSSGAGASGVYGAATATDLAWNYGVLGEAKGQISGSAGVQGRLLSPAGAVGPRGSLGRRGPPDYGVYSNGDAHVEGTFTATTNKGFVQPHPNDASKEIRYISLEGPHTEVYFRGTAQVSQGVTRIPIPQHFRFVADPATYSTLVTPVGAMATTAVVSEGPEGIVVVASRNVKVHYVVYAEREAVRNPDPIIENVHFRPDPDADFLAHLPDSFRQLMIQNGTLNSDGTVNMETARRLGWDKEWEKRKPPAPQPSSD